MNLQGLLAAIGLRHAGHTDERVLLNVGERRLDDAAHGRVVGELDLVGLAVAGLHRDDRPVRGFYRAAHPNRLRLLGKGDGCGEDQAKRGRPHGPPNKFTHYRPPKRGPDRAPARRKTKL